MPPITPGIDRIVKLLNALLKAKQQQGLPRQTETQQLPPDVIRAFNAMISDSPAAQEIVAAKPDVEAEVERPQVYTDYKPQDVERLVNQVAEEIVQKISDRGEVVTDRQRRSIKNYVSDNLYSDIFITEPTVSRTGQVTPGVLQRTISRPGMTPFGAFAPDVFRERPDLTNIASQVLTLRSTEATVDPNTVLYGSKFFLAADTAFNADRMSQNVYDIIYGKWSQEITQGVRLPLAGAVGHAETWMQEYKENQYDIRDAALANNVPFTQANNRSMPQSFTQIMAETSLDDFDNGDAIIPEAGNTVQQQRAQEAEAEFEGSFPAGMTIPEFVKNQLGDPSALIDPKHKRAAGLAQKDIVATLTKVQTALNNEGQSDTDIRRALFDTLNTEHEPQYEELIRGKIEALEAYDVTKLEGRKNVLEQFAASVEGNFNLTSITDDARRDFLQRIEDANGLTDELKAEFIKELPELQADKEREGLQTVPGREALAKLILANSGSNRDEISDQDWKILTSDIANSGMTKDQLERKYQNGTGLIQNMVARKIEATKEEEDLKAFRKAIADRKALVKDFAAAKKAVKAWLDNPLENTSGVRADDLEPWLIDQFAGHLRDEIEKTAEDQMPPSVASLMLRFTTLPPTFDDRTAQMMPGGSALPGLVEAIKRGELKEQIGTEDFGETQLAKLLWETGTLPSEISDEATLALEKMLADSPGSYEFIKLNILPLYKQEEFDRLERETREEGYEAIDELEEIRDKIGLWVEGEVGSGAVIAEASLHSLANIAFRYINAAKKAGQPVPTIKQILSPYEDQLPDLVQEEQERVKLAEMDTTKEIDAKLTEYLAKLRTPLGMGVEIEESVREYLKKVVLAAVVDERQTDINVILEEHFDTIFQSQQNVIAAEGEEVRTEAERERLKANKAFLAGPGISDIVKNVLGISPRTSPTVRGALQRGAASQLGDILTRAVQGGQVDPVELPEVVEDLMAQYGVTPMGTLAPRPVVSPEVLPLKYHPRRELFEPEVFEPGAYFPTPAIYEDPLTVEEEHEAMSRQLTAGRPPGIPGGPRFTDDAPSRIPVDAHSLIPAFGEAAGESVPFLNWLYGQAGRLQEAFEPISQPVVQRSEVEPSVDPVTGEVVKAPYGEELTGAVGGRQLAAEQADVTLTPQEITAEARRHTAVPMTTPLTFGQYFQKQLPGLREQFSMSPAGLQEKQQLLAEEEANRRRLMRASGTTRVLMRPGV